MAEVDISKSKTDPGARALNTVHLPSGRPTHHPTTVGFNVENGGVIQERLAPAGFIVSKNEIVTWVIGNTSDGPIEVSLLDFKFRPLLSKDPKGSEDIDPQPFIWLGSNTVVLASRKVGFITGLLDPNYRHRNLLGVHDHLTYTIAVRSGDGVFEDVDYDPDGEIKP